MNIELKTVSQPLAKRMKELGWNYETERYWHQVTVREAETCLQSYNRMGEWELANLFHRDGDLPAPDAIEIYKELPSGHNGLGVIKNRRGYYSIHRNDINWKINDTSLSEALREMWCYLKEKKLI